MCNGTFIDQYKELFDIMRRTRIQDFEKIEQARDLERIFYRSLNICFQYFAAAKKV